MLNRFLHSLEPDVMEALRPHLVAVELPVRTVLQQPDLRIEFAYFLEAGLASLIAVAGKTQIEVGVVGAEGLVGQAALLGAEEAPFLVVMQIGGSGLRIPVEEVRRQMDACTRLRASILRYVHATTVQISHTAIANGRYTVEQRLARWLLMANDRLGDSDIALTHDFLATMLGVRRPGVTVALHMLEGAHAIRSRRNSILVTDRAKLKELAGDAYGGPERLYARLFPAAGEAELV